MGQNVDRDGDGANDDLDGSGAVDAADIQQLIVVLEELVQLRLTMLLAL